MSPFPFIRSLITTTTRQTRWPARTRASNRRPCQDLRLVDAAGARYILIGGFAVIAQGASRTTNDIDLLIDPAPANIARIRTALGILEDQAVNEVADDDVSRYTVVRVADEFVIDLMALACGVDYTDAMKDAETLDVAGVPVIVASPATLIRTKNTFRPSDQADRRYLDALITERNQG